MASRDSEGVRARIAAQAARPGKTQAQLIHEQVQRAQRRFTRGVIISWIVLLALLLLMFTGVRVTFGPQGFVVAIPALDRVLFSLPVSIPFQLINLKSIRLDWEFIRTWAPDISRGIWQTILISLLSILFATLLALLAALGRLSRVPPVYALSTFYISLIRGTPLFLQVFFFYLALPQVGILLPGLYAGVLALGLNYGAYMSEIFRAGILSVGKGQREAAMALGMTYSQLMRRIVLPQALRFAIPPTGNEFIAMLKDSALVSATGAVHETMWRATKAGRANFRNLEALLIAAVFYWLLTLVFTALQSRLEKYMGRGER
jgi:polar amino acid transport system permease protein